MALEAGIAYVYSDAVFLLRGIPTLEITKFSFKVSQEYQQNWSTGKNATSLGRGKESFEASLTMSYAQLVDLIRSSPEGKPTLLAPFSIQKVMVPPSGGVPFTVTMTNCVFMEFGIDMSTGDMEILSELTILPGDIIIS
jgi:hypothetical protein